MPNIKKNNNILPAILLFLFVTIALIPGFYRNQWNMAGKKRFPEWRLNSNYMLVGRLAHSKQAGIFASGALLGTVDGGWPTPPGIAEHQYDVYLNHLEYETFFTYNSAIGFQGILFSLFDIATDYPENFNLKVFSGVTAVLSAIMMACFVVWFFLQFGALPAVFVFVFILLSEWITLFAGDIYWQLWAFYLPTIIAFYYFLLQKNEGYRASALPILIFLSVLIKILFNGFEFISTTLVMIYTPLVYYSFVQNWSFRRFADWSIKIGLSAILAVFSGLGILIAQLSTVLGGWIPALSYVNSTILRRTYGSESNALDVDLATVLWTYISGRAFNFQIIADMTRLPSLEEVSYLTIFIIFIIASVIFLAISFYQSTIFDLRMKALFWTMWFSVISALSWFIIFKGHSSVHTHLNYIVWQMPFTIISFAFLGNFVKVLLSQLKRLIVSLSSPNLKSLQD